MVTEHGFPAVSAISSPSAERRVSYRDVSVYRVNVILFSQQLHKYANRFFLNIEPAGDSKISVTTRGQNLNHCLNLNRLEDSRSMQIEDVE